MTRTEKLSRRHKMRTDRLNLAFKRSGWSKRRFQRELQAWGVPGTSRANVDRYLKGEVDKPPVDFYVGTARLLGVPLPWLLGETDAATEEEIVFEQAARRTAIDKFWLGFDRKLEEGFPGYENLAEATRLTVRSAWYAYDHYLTFSEDPPQNSHAGVQELGAAIYAPLQKLSMDRTKLGEWQLNRYVTTVCQAIAFLNLEYGLHIEETLKKRSK
jgi:transcriptional regulator with XRE-family HTH domain